MTFILAAIFAIVASGCFVHTRGGGRGCGHGYRWNGNRCVATIHHKKKHKHNNGRGVVHRDHRR
jgi:hypothetical protein